MVEHNLQDTYLLSAHMLGSKQSLPITIDQYLELLHSRDILYDISSFEEKFFAICEHFRELEEFVFRTTFSSLLYFRMSAPDIHSTKAEFGRLTAALLSAVRLYLDSVCSHAKALSNGGLDKATIKVVSAKEYDSSFCYRVMEAIRNHAQHQAFPVHSVAFGRKWDEGHETLNYSVDFYFDVKQVNDNKFKSVTKSEIEDSGEKVDLKSCVRSYFFSVCNMHDEYRRLFKVYQQNAEANLRHWQDVWLKQFPDGKLIGIAACRFKGEFPNNDAEKALYSNSLTSHGWSSASSVRADLGLR